MAEGVGLGLTRRIEELDALDQSELAQAVLALMST